MSIASQITTPLEFGMVAGAIIGAQRALRMHGFNVQESGKIDRRTEVALYAFQRHSRMKYCTGVLDQETAAALDASTGAHPSSVHAPETRARNVIVAKFARPIWLEAALWALDGYPRDVGPYHRIDWAAYPAEDVMISREHERVRGATMFVNDALSGPGVIPVEHRVDFPLAFAKPGWGGVALNGIAMGAIAPMIEGGLDHVVIVVGQNGEGHPMCVGKNQEQSATLEPFAYERLNKGFWWPSQEPRPENEGLGSLPFVYDTGHFSHHGGVRHGDFG